MTRFPSLTLRRSAWMALLLVVGLYILPAHGTEKTTIAVANLQSTTLNEGEAAILSEQLREEFIKTGSFTVVERGRMDEILQEQGFQQTGCTSDECFVEMGQLIGVQMMVTGSVGSIGSFIIVSLKMIDVGTGEIVINESEKIKGTIDDVVTSGLKAVVEKVHRAHAGDSPKPVAVTSAPEPSVQGAEAETTGRPLRIHFYLLPMVALGDIGLADPLWMPMFGGMLKGGFGGRKNLLLLEFGFAVGSANAEKESRGEYDAVEGRVVGGSVGWYFEGLRIGQVAVISPGLKAGYWGIRDELIPNPRVPPVPPQETLSSHGIVGPNFKFTLGRNVAKWTLEIGALFVIYESGNSSFLNYAPNRDKFLLSFATGLGLVL